MSNTRDLIRAATVGAKKHFKKKSFYVETEDGSKVEVEFREPSRKERSKIQKKSVDKEGNLDSEAYIANFVIMLTFVPGTNERVFEEADLDSFLESPVSGFVERFGEQILELIRADDIKKTEKNLGPIQRED